MQQNKKQVLYCQFSALMGAHIVAQNAQTNQKKEFQKADSLIYDISNINL